MKILGISAHYHDAAAALLVHGIPVCAVQEERLSRRKNDAAFPLNAIEWCLDHAAYDCVYLALAIENNCQFVTADERFMRKLDRGHQRTLRSKVVLLSEAVKL